MIHYHGGPITPNSSAVACWTGRHAFVSFERPDQIEIAAEVCQTFALDNGAFSVWKRGANPDWAAYKAWVAEWCDHPGFDFAIIPDSIEGDEQDNERLIDEWPFRPAISVPVWHLHECTPRLRDLCRRFPKVALGSSGAFAEIGTPAWNGRMESAMRAVCDQRGRPFGKLHGLRMLDPDVFGRFPFHSADSTNVARNIGIDSRWRGTYTPPSKDVRAQVLASRIESRQSAAAYEFQRQLQLSGTAA